MSVSQIKKRFEGFSAYLGRDTRGQEKLKKLKDAVNELRTQLTSAQANEAHARELTEAITERATKAERELASAKSEMERMQQINQNLSRDLQIATATTASHEAPNAQKDVPGESELKRVVKRLREKMRFCPKAQRRFAYGADDPRLGSPLVFDRDSLAKGWSHEALWTLGASVALLAFLRGEVVLESRSKLRDLPVKDAEDDSSVNCQIFMWFNKNVEHVNHVEDKWFASTAGRLSAAQTAQLAANGVV